MEIPQRPTVPKSGLTSVPSTKCGEVAVHRVARSAFWATRTLALAVSAMPVSRAMSIQQRGLPGVTALRRAAQDPRRSTPEAYRRSERPSRRADPALLPGLRCKCLRRHEPSAERSMPHLGVVQAWREGYLRPVAELSVGILVNTCVPTTRRRRAEWYRRLRPAHLPLGHRVPTHR